MTPPRPPTVAAAQEVWRQHYASAAGARWWPAEELVRCVARRDLTQDTVVEVGCGNGANLWFLAEQARAVVGLDLSGEALSMASKYMRVRGSTAALVCADGALLPLASASVDGVVDVMASQHVGWEAHLALYREYRRALNADGWLFLYHLVEGTTMRGSRPVGARTHDHLPLFPQAGPTCVPPSWALRDVVEEAGFAVRDARHLIRAYPDGMCAVYEVIEGEAA